MPLRPLLSTAALAGLLAVSVGAATAPAAGLNDPEYDKQWGLQVIGAKAAWDAGLFGAGVEIAVVDTGVHLSHQDLRRNVVPGRNFVDPARPPQDDNQHGTHVAGIAAASIDDGGTVGVAPRAKILPLKALRADGGGSIANVAAAIRFAADAGAEVINLSLGELDQSVFGPSTQEAVAYAWSKGSICVFAAGNDFVLPSGFEDEPAIVVSSTSRRDTESDFSNGVGNAMWGMAAPGGAESSVLDPSTEDIFSTIWVSDDRKDTYRYLAGTSMAAPHVAGAAALLRGAGLTPQQTVDRLLATARDLGPRGRDATFGHGRLDVAKAVQGLSSSPSVSAAPTATTAAPAPPAGAAPTGSTPPPTTTRRQSNDRPRPAPTPAPASEAPAARAERAAEPPAEIVEAPAVPADRVEPDDGFREAGDADGDDAAGDETAAGDVDRLATDDTAWPWVVLAGIAALGVGGTAGRLVWRRRSAGGPPQ